MTSRILIVEDSATQAAALAHVLAEAGFETARAADGEAGLEMVGQGHFDLVISDIVMPGPVDGYEVCRRVKEADASTPVVLLTSLSDPMDIIRGLEAGADNFFTKPYEGEDLIERLRTLMKLRKARRGERFSMGVRIVFMGRELMVTAEREQILDMLLTTFEQAVKQNHELRRREGELTAAKAELARYAKSLEARLERLADSIPDVLYSMTSDGRIVYASKASQAVFGLPPDELSYEAWASRIHPLDRKGVLEAVEDTIHTLRGRTVGYRYVVGDNDDHVSWIQQSLFPIKNGKVGIQRLDGIARDVTEQHESERRTRESEERYRSLVEVTSHLLLTMGPHGLVFEPIPTWQEYTGQSFEEVAVEGWMDALHPDDRDRIQRAWQSALERRTWFLTEFRVRRQDGAYRHFGARGAPVVDGGGTLREWVIACSDITDRMAAQQAVFRQTEYLRILQSVTVTVTEALDFETALSSTLAQVCRRSDWDVGHVYLPDPESGVLRSSGIWYPAPPNEYEALRVATEQTSLAPGQGLIGAVAASKTAEWIADLTQTGLLLHSASTPDIGVRCVLVVPVLVGYEVVAVMELFSRTPREPDQTFLDVVGQIGMQLGRVWERLRGQQEKEAVEAQVLQAQKMEAVGRLAGGVAHDFNNVLTVVLAEAEFLGARLEVNGSEELSKAVSEIKVAAGRAAALTRQLLTFSRQDIARPEVFDPREVVEGLRGMLARLIGEDIDLSIGEGEPVGRIRADRGQLEQVIVNLIVNARDAMPTGGGLSVTMSAVELDESYAAAKADCDPGDYVLIAVSDTGMGMPEEVQRKVFEPFFTTKASDKGTGLGLATSYGIVRESGGHIAVYSEVGVGTTMKVYLPRVEEAGGPGLESPTEDATEGGPRTGGETVLLVEDDPSLRRIGERTLASLGYDVLVAESGIEAMEVLETSGDSVDLLFTDVVLPGMSGGDLAERARTLLPNLKVLFTSGYTDDAVLREKLLTRDAEVLTKPYTLSALGKKVRDVLDGAATVDPEDSGTVT